MNLLNVLFLTALTHAAAVPESAYRLPQPGSPVVKRAEATSGLVRLDGLSDDMNIVVSIALVTDAPEANAVRVEDPDRESCTQESICFDGITCGTRFGG